jgi:hypothetical protein
MAFCRITACMTVQEKDAPLNFIDSLVVENIRVFDSDICSSPLAEVPNADEIRREMPDQ